MNDFFDLHEIDIKDLKMTLFAQSLGGEVRKWFKALLAATIDTLEFFHHHFVETWE